MKHKLFDKITRIRWHMILAALIVLMLTTLPGVPYTASAASISVTRDSPDIVYLNETFEVTITFTASEDYFTPAIVDAVSEGWQVQVDSSWCTPEASESNITAEGTRAEYIWYNSVSAGTLFTVFYKVTVPGSVAEGTYSFSGGTMGYKIAGSATQFVNVTGKSQIYVKSVPESTDINNVNDDDSEITSPHDSESGINDTQIEHESDINEANGTTGIETSIEGSVAGIQVENPSSESAPSGSHDITPNPAPTEPPLLYPPTPQSKTINLPVLCGIGGGVIIIVILTLFRLRRRPYYRR